MMMAEMAEQKRRGGHHDAFLLTSVRSTTKKLKTGGLSFSPKEKKDKVGERVSALQQLVSPFGKTDTATVLHEATGYINFLHEQLQVLSAPYLRAGPDDGMLVMNHPSSFLISDVDQCSLRRRGLCLMPVASALKIARSNGADLWAPTPSTASKYF